MFMTKLLLLLTSLTGLSDAVDTDMTFSPARNVLVTSADDGIDGGGDCEYGYDVMKCGHVCLLRGCQQFTVENPGTDRARCRVCHIYGRQAGGPDMVVLTNVMTDNGAAGDIIEATCADRFRDLYSRDGRPIVFTCPLGNTCNDPGRTIWGDTQRYTDDSPLCMTVIHYYGAHRVVSGNVFIAYHDGEQNKFYSSDRNGISTTSYWNLFDAYTLGHEK